MGGGKWKRMSPHSTSRRSRPVRLGWRIANLSRRFAGRRGQLTATRSGSVRAATRGRRCGQQGRRQHRVRRRIYPSLDLRFDRAAQNRRGGTTSHGEGRGTGDNGRGRAEEPDSPRGGHVLALRDGFPRYGAKGAGTVPAPPARGRFPLTTSAAWRPPDLAGAARAAKDDHHGRNLSAGGSAAVRRARCRDQPRRFRERVLEADLR